MLECLRLISGNRAWQELHDFVQVLEGAVLDLNWLSFAPMHNPFDTKHSCLTNPNANPHRPHAGIAGEFRQAWGLLRGATATTMSSGK